MSKLNFLSPDINKLLNELASVDTDKNTITLGGVLYRLTRDVDASRIPKEVEDVTDYLAKMLEEFGVKLEALTTSTTSATATSNQRATDAEALANTAVKRADEREDEVEAIKSELKKSNDTIAGNTSSIERLRGDVDGLQTDELYLGMFDDTDTLNDQYPNGKIGCHAYVYNEDKANFVLAVKKASGWVTYPDITFAEVTADKVKDGGVSQERINLTLAVNAAIANRNYVAMQLVVNDIVNTLNELQKKAAYTEDYTLNIIPELTLAKEAIDKRDNTNVLDICAFPLTLQSRTS